MTELRTPKTMDELRTKYHIYDGMNDDRVQSLYSAKPMDFHIGEEETEDRERLLAEIEADFGYRFRSVAKCSPQFHSDIVGIVESDTPRLQFLPPGDGLLTDLPGVALEIRTADCQSIFLYDPVRGVVGNIHSGWKGTLQQIAVKAVRKMEVHYGCRPNDIKAYINPSILGCCFEVDEDVAQQFRESTENWGRYIRTDRVVEGRQKYLIDTAAINRDRLTALGLRPENVVLSGICTKCSHGRFHSYRGDGHSQGRNGSLIWLR